MKRLRTSNTGEFFSDSLLRHIAQRNNAEILSSIQDVNSSQLIDDSGETLLHHAVKYGNVWFVQHLIGLGANVDAQNHSMETPLALALINYQHEIVEVLLKANADIYLPDRRGHSGLRIAHDYDKNNIFIALLSQVTSESLKTSRHVENKLFHRHFPLYYFMPLKDADVIRVLLEKGSPVDAKKSYTGDTSLHMAVKQMDLEKAKVLLMFNADVNVKNREEDTPLACLRNLNDEDKTIAMFNVLISAGATLIDYDKRKILVHLLLSDGSKKVVLCVLNCKIELHFEDQYGYTPLHYLVQNLNPKVFAELRDFDFSVKIRTKSKYSMLHIAAAHGNLSSIQFLLDRGADINSKCGYGHTPLHYTIMYGCKHKKRLDMYVKIIEVLLERGADPFIMTEENEWRQWDLFDNPVTDAIVKLMNPVLAHLSLIENFEQEYMYNDILTIPEFMKIYNFYKNEHQRMEQIELGDSVTLLNFLRATDKRISSLARNRKIVLISNSAIENYDLDSCYRAKLQENLKKFTKLVELRTRAAATLDEFFSKAFNTSAFDVAQKIVEYLDDHELIIFL